MTGRFVKVKCECKNLFFQKKGSSKKELAPANALLRRQFQVPETGASFHGGCV